MLITIISQLIYSKWRPLVTAVDFALANALSHLKEIGVISRDIFFHKTTR